MGLDGEPELGRKPPRRADSSAKPVPTRRSPSESRPLRDRLCTVVHTFAEHSPLPCVLEKAVGMTPVTPLAVVRTGRARSGFVRVSRGRYRPALDPAELIDTLLAWQFALPPESAFSHLTAALVRGWWVPPLPRDLPVFAAVPDGRPPAAARRVAHLSPYSTNCPAALSGWTR